MRSRSSSSWIRMSSTCRSKTASHSSIRLLSLDINLETFGVEIIMNRRLTTGIGRNSSL